MFKTVLTLGRGAAAAVEREVLEDESPLSWTSKSSERACLLARFSPQPGWRPAARAMCAALVAAVADPVAAHSVERAQ
jgi:hypothetical protein